MLYCHKQNISTASFDTYASVCRCPRTILGATCTCVLKLLKMLKSTIKCKALHVPDSFHLFTML